MSAAAPPPLSSLIPAIYQACGNPGSSLFLPAVILEQWPSADPWSLPSFAFGDLAALDPTLPTRLCQALGAEQLASPASAVLTLTAITVSGLGNAVLAQPTLQGSTVNASVTFGGARLPQGVNLAPNPTVSASFTIALSCCTSQDGKTCAAAPQACTIGGSVTLSLASSSIALVLGIDGSFNVSVTSLAVTATPTAVTFQTTSPPAAAAAVNAVLNPAFATTAAGTAIVASINNALAGATPRARLAAQLTPMLQSVANPSLLSFVASQLYKAASDPNNALYLPKQIIGANNPPLDPYTVDGTWGLGDVSSFYPAAGMTICGAIGATQGTNDIATPNTPVQLTLSNITVAGLSNVMALPLNTVVNTIEALVVFGQVATWPRHFTIAGNFTLALSCCVTQDFNTCSGPPQPQVGSGTFSASVVAASTAANVTISADGNQLIATVDALNFRADANHLNPQNVVFDIDITSVPANQRDVWNAQAEKLFSSSQATEAIVGRIQAQMNQPSVLQQISQIITKAIAHVMSDEQAAQVLAEVRLAQNTPGRTA